MADFEEKRAITAELQIDQVQAADGTQATAVVRCIRGPVHLGAYFFRDPDQESINLQLTRIVCLGRPMDELDPAHTALVTLRGTGADRLRPGNTTAGWQIIQGSNPTT
jgi:hypothetical protein